MKDKLTSTTHEQREAERAKRAAEEHQAHERYTAYRAAMSRAIETGEPQLIGKDREGRDVYIQPPATGYDGQGGPAYSSLPMGARGYSPYMQGPYASPNARFITPDYPYQRPYGYGYGGGLGLPLMGGLMGGLLLGDMLGGGGFL